MSHEARSPSDPVGLYLNGLSGRVAERNPPPKLTMRGRNRIIYANIDPQDRKLKLKLGYQNVAAPPDA